MQEASKQLIVDTNTKKLKEYSLENLSSVSEDLKKEYREDLRRMYE